MYGPRFIHSPVGGYLDCCLFWAIMKKATVNILIQDFVRSYVFVSLGQTPKNGMDGSYGQCMFNFLRNCQTAFQSGCALLHSHQQRLRVPVPPHLCQHLYCLFLSCFVFIGWHSNGCVVVNHSLSPASIMHLRSFSPWQHCDEGSKLSPKTETYSYSLKIIFQDVAFISKAIGVSLGLFDQEQILLENRGW